MYVGTDMFLLEHDIHQKQDNSKNSAVIPTIYKNILQKDRTAHFLLIS